MAHRTSYKGFRLLSWVTGANALIACAFSLAGLIEPAWIVPPGIEPNQASTIFAGYAVARAVPLAILVLAAICRRSNLTLVALGVLACLVQLGDFIVGLFCGDIAVIVGSLFVAIVQLYALIVPARELAKPLLPSADTNL